MCPPTVKSGQENKKGDNSSDGFHQPFHRGELNSPEFRRLELRSVSATKKLVDFVWHCAIIGYG
jgi:hypothetical protein